MAIPRKLECFEDNFTRAQLLVDGTPNMNGWTLKDTSAAGTPTFLCTSNVGMVMTLASTSEAENVCMYMNDVLMLDVDQLEYFEFWASVAGVDAVTTITMGLGSARNDTPDTVTTNAWFRMEGSASTSNVVVESDNNATDNDDVATGQTLSTTVKRFHISFANGKTDIRYFMGNSTGALVRVAASTTFSLTGVTSAVQPIFQLQKASGTGVPALTIRRVEWKYRVYT